MYRLFQHKKLLYLFLVPLIVGVGFVCCDNATNDDDDNNDDNEPPPQAQISIRSEPDPVPYAGDSEGYHYWPFRLVVEESAGTGATVLEWNYEMYENDGALLAARNHTIDEFVQWFVDCDPGAPHINSNGTLCVDSFAYISQGHEEGWYAIDKMQFLDDNGNEFWIEGRITMLPIR